jgi:hypothetical protein
MKCDCCRVGDSIGVASSGYAAVSFSWCVKCLQIGAEPESILYYLYWYVGDRGKGLVDEKLLPHTYKDGRYWSWSEYKAWADTQEKPKDVEDYENS